MQNALTMPVVLRAAITAKQWIAKENKFASMVMEESVTNLQFLAVIMTMVGFFFMFGMSVSWFYPAVGIVLMAKGVSILNDEEKGGER